MKIRKLLLSIAFISTLTFANGQTQPANGLLQVRFIIQHHGLRLTISQVMDLLCPKCLYRHLKHIQAQVHCVL